ncbi:MAG: hypothetical protein JF588_14775 [Caulobacterales bacterium]|nr:hypothetical protein [Caulobacterales bacterium]
MTARTLGFAAAAALLLAGAAQAQSPAPATDPDRPSTPGKLPPTRTAPVMGGTVRNGNAAVQDPVVASMGQSADAASRTADEARRHKCERHPPAPDNEKAWRACEAVGVAAPR